MQKIFNKINWFFDTGWEIWSGLFTSLPYGDPYIAILAPRLGVRFCRDTGGATAIFVALLLPMILGMMGLTVDVGVWYLEKRGLQTIADAASLAGGSEIANGSSDASVVAAATADANRNDFDPTKDTITVNLPPTSGPNAGVDGSVEVIITRQMPLFFTAVFFNLIGDTPRQFNATARAVVNTVFADEFCILGLDPAEPKAVEVVGSGSATLDCGIAVNSTASNALFVGGDAAITTTSVTTVGQVSVIGAGFLDSDATPRRGAEVDDPYSDLAIPAFSGCDAGSIGGGGSGTTATGDETFDAAGGVFVFCGGFAANAGSTVTLGPGVYIIDQGDFKINGGAAIVGDGVTIILTSSGANSTIGKASITGGADIALTAPTTDPSGASGFSGVLFFQDRNVSSNPTKRNLIAGGTELELEGALYFPSQELNFAGGSTLGDSCTQLVAKKVTITGDTGVQTNCNSSGTRSIGRLKAFLGE